MLVDPRVTCECGHPRSDHDNDYVSFTNCNHDLDADYDYELGRYVKTGGCDCPEFIPYRKEERSANSK